MFFELYRYFTGQGIYNGHVGYLDFQSDSKNNMDVDTPDVMWDTGVELGKNYVSPLAHRVAWHGAVARVLDLELTPRGP